MKNIIGSIIVGVIVLLGVFYTDKPSINLGSVTDGQAYTSTSTDSTYANSRRQIKSSSGVLGSVVVLGTSATVVEIKNATSTTDIASTTIAIMTASPATGTYVFDAAFDRGLVVNFLGSFTGSYAITYR